jgi:hypothetical protein
MSTSGSDNCVLLARLADEFADRYRRGERPSLTEYVERYPHLDAASQGKDADQLDDQQRARLRQQARDWLKADLDRWAPQAESDNPKERDAVQKRLKHWQTDADLAGIRDKDAVAKLPAEEQDACRKLWAEVETPLQKAREQAPP